jgi:hypothetical protein
VKTDSAAAAATRGPDISGNGLWEDGSNGGGSVKMNFAAAAAGRSSRRGRRGGAGGQVQLAVIGRRGWLGTGSSVVAAFYTWWIRDLRQNGSWA